MKNTFCSNQSITWSVVGEKPCWLEMMLPFVHVTQGHRWSGEVQQHHISLLPRRQGNSAGVWHHKAGDLWRPAQMDENDWQGKQTAEFYKLFLYRVVFLSVPSPLFHTIFSSVVLKQLDYLIHLALEVYILSRCLCLSATYSVKYFWYCCHYFSTTTFQSLWQWNVPGHFLTIDKLK